MKRRSHNIDITEEDIEIYKNNQKQKRKGSIVVKLLIFTLIIGLFGQIGYFVYTNRALLFKAKLPQPTVVVTPKEELKLTAYEQKTEASVKAFPTFVGKKEEAVAVAHDFTAKYFTMSNLKSQLDFLGNEYIYPNNDVKENFKEYTLTNYYYYFPDMQNTFGQEGLPEIEATKLVDIQETSYVHEAAEKVQGYGYSLLNGIEKDSGFMKKKFKGYNIELTFSYLATQKTLSWAKTAPDTINMSVLFDADSGKWFIAEFQTSSSIKKTSDVTIVNPNQIKG